MGMLPSRGLLRCLRCRQLGIVRHSRRYFLASDNRLGNLESARPSIAPKWTIDVKHIRQNADSYRQSCIDRNYKEQSTYPSCIVSLFEEWKVQQEIGRKLRERSNILLLSLANPKKLDSQVWESVNQLDKAEVREEARRLKQEISVIESKENAINAEIDHLASSIPNLTSAETPIGSVPTLLRYINMHPFDGTSSSKRHSDSHVDIGKELNILNFSAAATSSGWGWYYLLNEAALLEQALVQYAISVAMKRGWEFVIPPSIVYSHIATACGFMPRDHNGEQQIYALTQRPEDQGRKPEHSLAATAEIPLAAMNANTTIQEDKCPIKKVAVSRCYRAEAGARGVDTKGLYRVHEFTKVEMFAWTTPSESHSEEVFAEILSIQTEILESLGLHCRMLEMPSTDLGASAARKVDIEAFFPSRAKRDDGWGEVTSVSICRDYQSRRLATRQRSTGHGNTTAFPFTVNGTALAVPRVLAAILENNWSSEDRIVSIPRVLWPWMAGIKSIGMRSRADQQV